MSIRVDLTKLNMDLVMGVVRSLDMNPSQAVNKLLSEPELLSEAWSEINESRKGQKGDKKRQKTPQNT